MQRKIDLYEEPSVKGADGEPLTTRVLKARTIAGDN
jgi:hypothetical protein